MPFPVGWLIDPLERTMFVYRPNQQIEVFDEPDSLLIASKLISIKFALYLVCSFTKGHYGY